MDVSFCVAALEEALLRFGKPEVVQRLSSLRADVRPEGGTWCVSSARRDLVQRG